MAGASRCLFRIRVSVSCTDARRRRRAGAAAHFIAAPARAAMPNPPGYIDEEWA
jgi:hypothetical protein